MSARLHMRRVRHRRETHVLASDAAVMRARRESAVRALPVPKVRMVLHLEEARRMSLGMADILCWAAGFRAARPDADDHPMGVFQVRDLRDALERAIRLAEGEIATAEIPF